MSEKISLDSSDYCYELVFTFFVHGSGLPASFGRL